MDSISADKLFKDDMKMIQLFRRFSTLQFKYFRDKTLHVIN